jgi:hypothetical protein
MKLDNTTAGSVQNALFMAQASSLAYFDEPDGPRQFQDQLGLEAHLISVGNTQAYLAQNEEAVVVAFRGSQAPTTLDGLKDWLLTNANNYLIIPEGRIGTDFAAAGVGARFHRGFMEALAEIWDPLLKSVSEALESKDRPLWLTGHSLGGALALMTAWRLQRNFISVHEVVTFGAPMVGNEAAAQAFEREFAGKVFRYVNLEDPVPLLPSISLVANTYAHCPTEVSLTVVSSFVSALDTLKQSAGTAVDRLLEAASIDQLWNVIQGRISAHFIGHYQERVKEKCSPGSSAASAPAMPVTAQTQADADPGEAE